LSGLRLHLVAGPPMSRKVRFRLPVREPAQRLSEHKRVHLRLRRAPRARGPVVHDTFPKAWGGWPQWPVQVQGLTMSGPMGPRK
ncbi:MAG: hypothetical protein WA880_07985, partial [Ornithinimicrobium sp.]